MSEISENMVDYTDEEYSELYGEKSCVKKEERKVSPMTRGERRRRRVRHGAKLKAIARTGGYGVSHEQERNGKVMVQRAYRTKHAKWLKRYCNKLFRRAVKSGTLEYGRKRSPHSLINFFYQYY